MTIEMDVDPGAGIVTYRVTGCPGYEEFSTAITGRLEHLDFKSDMDVLWDLRDSDFTQMETRTLRKIAKFVKQNTERYHSGYKIALVASSNLEYGLSRVYEAYVGILPTKLHVFRKPEDAIDWFGQPRES